MSAYSNKGVSQVFVKKKKTKNMRKTFPSGEKIRTKLSLRCRFSREYALFQFLYLRILLSQENRAIHQKFLRYKYFQHPLSAIRGMM